MKFFYFLLRLNSSPKGSRITEKGAARRPPNMNIISYLFSPVYPQFLQLFSVILMEHPILKNQDPRCIMKIQKRSESNVLSKLTPIKTVES